MTGSHGLYVTLAYFLAKYGVNQELFRTTAVGISALLFALKVLANSRTVVPNAPTSYEFMGVILPAEAVAWAELIWISLITPNASFTGHLCGLVAGLLFIPLYKYRHRSRILQLFMALFGIGWISSASHRRNSSAGSSHHPEQRVGRRIDGGRILDHGARSEFSVQMRQLREMGFLDDERNRDALDFSNGDIERAVAYLTRSR
eukprot:TRINITY_DN1112_c0_g1_i1.p1 TRINITY_DN1112_c0_g1~~TRINITY_DN1112_c0_g1_i1.p1  ORF type:complete len:203 (-),score=44.58 TRINITY_DN1112_c0_g1_i1:801-1409(-)